MQLASHESLIHPFESLSGSSRLPSCSLTTGLLLLLLLLLLDNSYLNRVIVLRRYCLIVCGERLANQCIFGAWGVVRVTRVPCLLDVTSDLQVTACQPDMRWFALVWIDWLLARFYRRGHEDFVMSALPNRIDAMPHTCVHCAEERTMLQGLQLSAILACAASLPVQESSTPAMFRASSVIDMDAIGPAGLTLVPALVAGIWVIPEQFIQNGIVTLAANTRPVIGSSWGLSLSGSPATGTVGLEI
ncbi:MAG: hypothetical protein ACI9SE_004551 [Neolewinella sp.]|jgi:hypothetical protein